MDSFVGREAYCCGIIIHVERWNRVYLEEVTFVETNKCNPSRYDATKHGSMRSRDD